MNQSFQVSGMSCDHCVRVVTQALKQVDPEARVQVDLAQGKVEVDSTQSRDTLTRAIVDEGFRVAP
ncbi:heavy-metal-associated domain-containing protein [Caldimonas brevitalea]|uniref:Copper chaperone n=1 Tax=Caldimonas brevitalea TaxID=413882 RepID=A0A0G3BI82_9BURK|nr:cation transporter [Caldimonas brevitalea]AKJ27703.1 copper chaperone [Caldimonas brevitalea]